MDWLDTAETLSDVPIGDEAGGTYKDRIDLLYKKLSDRDAARVEAESAVEKKHEEATKLASVLEDPEVAALIKKKLDAIPDVTTESEDEFLKKVQTLGV